MKKKVFISLIILTILEIILGYILGNRVYITTQEHINFYEILTLIMVSIILFIIFNIVSFFLLKYSRRIINKILRYYFLSGSIIAFIITLLNIRLDAYIIIGVMLIIPILLSSLIWTIGTRQNE